jgi:sirohydrochlorin cobaltochelatase
MKTAIRHTGIRHAAIRVRNLSQSLQFWKGILGFASYRELESDWAMVSRGETSLSLIAGDYEEGAAARNPTGVGPSPGGIHHLGITVEDPLEVDAWHSVLTAARKDWPALQVHAPKLHRDKSYGFYFVDPDGNPFEVIWIPVIHCETRDLPAIVLLGHGSRDPRWPLPILTLKSLLEKEHPGILVEVAWMEFAEPDLNQALTSLINRKAPAEVRIHPVFISAGGHVSHDLPELVDQARKDFPALSLSLEGPLGETSAVLQAMKTEILIRAAGAN